MIQTVQHSRFLLLGITLILGCSSKPTVPPPNGDVKPFAPIVAKNEVFTAPLGDVRVRRLTLPNVEGGMAVWGATGRDHTGTIYVGVSCESKPGASAHLLAINPNNDSITDLGGVLENCQRLKIDCPAQNKIHTKILQAADGKLYFASMDETGEAEDGSIKPHHGSHLWRIDGTTWEHLGHVPEGVIACAVGGRYVYYLGYPGHVLTQYDTMSGEKKTVRVGSIGGHTTRNIFADSNGHVYVPRVRTDAVELVEFNRQMQEVKSQRLDDYSLTPDSTSHGIVGIAPLKDGRWIFTTDRGRCYRLMPRDGGFALEDLTKFDGYPSCVFSPDGDSQVCALVENKLARTWQTLTAKQPLDIPPGRKNVLTYGSYTRDDSGRCYIVGRDMDGDRSIPAVWVVE